jgi:hypothetical protein
MKIYLLKHIITYIYTNLSILIAHKLKIDAVQSSTSKEIHISHNIHPNGHEPKIEAKEAKKKND